VRVVVAVLGFLLLGVPVPASRGVMPSAFAEISCTDTGEGDCCLPSGRGVAEGTLCADDGNECTADTCIADGLCAHATIPGGPCVDPEYLCEQRECGNGFCYSHATPGKGCIAATGTESLFMRWEPEDEIVWKWRGMLPSDVTFGDPLGTTGYALCVYGYGKGGGPFTYAAALIDAGGDCGGRPCWTERGGKLRYRSAGRPRSSAVLASRGARAAIRFALHGENVTRTSQVFKGISLHVQLRRLDDGRCFETSHRGNSRRRRFYRSRGD
jgi:hypothetical protein